MSLWRKRKRMRRHCRQLFKHFLGAVQIHNNSKSRCGCSESVCDGGGVVGGGSRSPPPQTPPRRTHFRGCHNDILLFMNSSSGEEHIPMADNAAACSFVAATAIWFRAPFERQPPVTAPPVTPPPVTPPPGMSLPPHAATASHAPPVTPTPDAPPPWWRHLFASARNGEHVAGICCCCDLVFLLFESSGIS